MIKPYLGDRINNHKTCCLEKYRSGIKAWVEETPSEWKIQLTMAINFVSSKDSDETSTMHTKCNNVEIMVRSETDETIRELFESLLQLYQKNLEESMRGSEFVSDSVDSLYCNLNKISLSRSGSYIDSPKWLKNNDDKCFQYALTFALNYQNIKNNPERSLLLINTIGKR